MCIRDRSGNVIIANIAGSAEEDYQKLLQIVHEDKVKAVNDLESGKKDMAEYYTMCVLNDAPQSVL